MTISRVSPQVEQLLFEAAAREATKIGVPMSFSIVDASGHLAAFLRMPGAGWVTAELATGKARASAAFLLPTAELAEKWAAANLFTTALITQHDGRFVPAPGGVPLIVDATVVGAIGASGGTGAQDAGVLMAAVHEVLLAP